MPSDATIAVCFSPEDDCATFAERAIDGADREILVSAYRLTVGSGVVGALIRAKERGVDVRVIADRGAPCGRASGIEPLAAASVPVWIDNQARLAHAKTMVIDGAVTLQGSYNWTRGAADNSEDLNLISSPTVAAAYAGHWRQRLAISVPFEFREDWCRGGNAMIRERLQESQTLAPTDPCQGAAGGDRIVNAGGVRSHLMGKQESEPMANRWLAWLFRGALDRLAYLVMQARLWVIDAAYKPFSNIQSPY